MNRRGFLGKAMGMLASALVLPKVTMLRRGELKAEEPPILAPLGNGTPWMLDNFGFDLDLGIMGCGPEPFHEIKFEIGKEVDWGEPMPLVIMFVDSTPKVCYQCGKPLPSTRYSLGMGGILRDDIYCSVKCAEAAR